MTTDRWPVHLLILGGLSTGMYALSLAAITGAQSASDAGLQAERAPIRTAADRLTSAHDDLDAALLGASGDYEAAAGRYLDVSARLVELESAIDRLASRVTAVTGAADALPTRVRMPAVSVVASAPKPSKPVVHAKTGASG